MPIFNTRVIGITPCAAVQEDNTYELDDDASNERIGVLLRSGEPLKPAPKAIHATEIPVPIREDFVIVLSSASLFELAVAYRFNGFCKPTFLLEVEFPR